MIKKYKDRFVKRLENSGFLAWTRTTSIPGAQGVSIFDLYLFLRHESKQMDIVTRANSMAFSFLLSLFPLLILLITLLPYFPVYDTFNDTIRSFISELMPGQAGNALYRFITDLTTRPQGDVISISFVMVIFFSSEGVMAMVKGFEKTYPDTFETWTGWHKRLRAVFLTFLLAFILIASVIMIVLGNVILEWILEKAGVAEGSFQSQSLYFLRWLVIIMLFYSGISSIYRFAVSARRRFRFFTPGASLATILSIITSYLFSYYIDNFSTYNKLYGSIGTIIGVMLWIQLNAFILLVGFELNASIAITRDFRIMQEQKIIEK